MKTKPSSQVLPNWLPISLQGLTFWTGYRKVIYHEYHLSEGAIVAELCALLYAKISSTELVVLPEVMFKNLLKVDSENSANNVDLTRADLVVADRFISKEVKTNRDDNIADQTKFVIEVKRNDAGWSNLKNDLLKLYAFIKGTKNSQVRCFLIVVSESGAPKKFVSNGQSIRGKQKISDDCSGYYKVRRTVKTATSINPDKWKSAIYACVLEVFL